MAATKSTSTLQITVNDTDGNRLPCRIHLVDQQGQAQKVEGLPFWHDHFVCSGRVAVPLSSGAYDYTIERGPEYARETGQVRIAAEDDQDLNITLERITNLRDSAWYSGDLHVHRPVDEVELLMQAEDLDFAPVITWWNNRNLWKEKTLPAQVTQTFDGKRIYTRMAGEDEREGGALLYFGLPTPLDIETGHREFPSPMQFVQAARSRSSDVWIDIEKPFWWDVPVWLASGQMNSIGIANNHMCRSQMYPSEAWGRPRDAERLPPPRGNGYWTQEIYYHLLNCGLRLPPSAGSASGVLPNPVGYNRVYVHLDKPFTRDAWFQSLSQGSCFVTNGPLLLVTANGKKPGSTFQLENGNSKNLHLDIQLTSQDPVLQIEVIQNGKVAATVDCTDSLTQEHQIEFTVDQPGWFLVRAIADVDHTFRFASTAPWYVETNAAKQRISKRSAQFFLDWVNERIERVKANIDDEQQRSAVLGWHQQAQGFWTQRLKAANAD